MSSKQVVHSYWAGPMPPIIELCLESIERHYKLVLHESPRAQTAGMIPRVQANHLRLTLLERAPCVWMDADCVAFGAIDWTPYKKRTWYAYRYFKHLQTYWLKSARPLPGLSHAYLTYISRVRMHENHLTQFVKRQVKWPIRILEPRSIWNVSKHDDLLRVYDGRPLKGKLTHLIHTTIDAMKDLSRNEVLSTPTLAGEILRRA